MEGGLWDGAHIFQKIKKNLSRLIFGIGAIQPIRALERRNKGQIHGVISPEPIKILQYDPTGSYTEYFSSWHRKVDLSILSETGVSRDQILHKFHKFFASFGPNIVPISPVIILPIGIVVSD